MELNTTLYRYSSRNGKVMLLTYTVVAVTDNGYTIMRNDSTVANKHFISHDLKRPYAHTSINDAMVAYKKSIHHIIKTAKKQVKDYEARLEQALTIHQSMLAPNEAVNERDAT